MPNLKEETAETEETEETEETQEAEEVEEAEEAEEAEKVDFKKLLLLSLLLSAVHVLLYPVISISTGESKARGFYVDENALSSSITSNSGGHRVKPMPVPSVNDSKPVKMYGWGNEGPASSLLLTFSDPTPLIPCVSSNVQSTPHPGPLIILPNLPSPPPPHRTHVHVTVGNADDAHVVLHPTRVNLDALAVAHMVLMRESLPFHLSTPSHPTYLSSLKSLLVNSFLSSNHPYLHATVPPSSHSCRFLSSLVIHLSTLEERLHHSIFFYVPFMSYQVPSFVSNGEWTYTFAVLILGMAYVAVMRGGKSAWEGGHSDLILPLLKVAVRVSLLEMCCRAVGLERVSRSCAHFLAYAGARIVGKRVPPCSDGDIAVGLSCYLSVCMGALRLFEEPSTGYIMMSAQAANAAGLGGRLGKIVVAAITASMGEWIDWMALEVEDMTMMI